TSFKRLGGRRTDLMTNKSYAITTSLMRIGLLTAQIAVSPSAAAQTMPANASQQPALMGRETDLALSACPPLVKRKTAVYAMENSRYLKLHSSDNGSSAIVQRSSASCGPGGGGKGGTTGAPGFKSDGSAPAVVPLPPDTIPDGREPPVSSPAAPFFFPATTCPSLSAKML